MRDADTECEQERIRCIEPAAEQFVEEGLRNVSGAGRSTFDSLSQRLKRDEDCEFGKYLSKVLEPEALTKSGRRGPQSGDRDGSFEVAFGVRGCLGDIHPIRSMCLKQISSGEAVPTFLCAFVLWCGDRDCSGSRCCILLIAQT